MSARAGSLAEFGGLVADRATVLSGRCLPYGEGITYWPLAEVVRMAAAIDEADDRDAAMAKLRFVAAGAADVELVAERIGLAIGLATGSAPAEEISWATRQLLETLARRRPLVIEFDDIQWADEAFLDLLEYIVSLAHRRPPPTRMSGAARPARPTARLGQWTTPGHQPAARAAGSRVGGPADRAPTGRHCPARAAAGPHP